MTIETAPLTKKRSIYLTNQQKWEIAKYCIENKCVRQNNGKLFNFWRVTPKVSAEEVNNWNDREQISFPTVNEYHIKSSVDFYNEVCLMTDNLPEVPKHESVQEEILKIEITKLNQRIEKLQQAALDFAATMKVCKDRFDQIKKLSTI